MIRGFTNALVVQMLKFGSLTQSHQAAALRPMAILPNRTRIIYAGY